MRRSIPHNLCCERDDGNHSDRVDGVTRVTLTVHYIMLAGADCYAEDNKMHCPVTNRNHTIKCTVTVTHVLSVNCNPRVCLIRARRQARARSRVAYGDGAIGPASGLKGLNCRCNSGLRGPHPEPPAKQASRRMPPRGALTRALERRSRPLRGAPRRGTRRRAIPNKRRALAASPIRRKRRFGAVEQHVGDRHPAVGEFAGRVGPAIGVVGPHEAPSRAA